MGLFGSSGIRAVFDKDLLEMAFQVGLAVGHEYRNAVVGRDTRTSSDAMKHAVVAGLLAAGAGCRDAGIVPTPALALAARRLNVGIMITASHNPPEYNGIKLINPDGSSFGGSQQREIEESLTTDQKSASWRNIKASTDYPDAIDEHIAAIRKVIPGKLRLKVVVDAAGGAASRVTPRLLEGLGCRVVAMNCEENGVFPRPAEPTEANLAGLSQAVVESGADVGIAHDGDADRMMAVDEQGRFISGDKLLVILARSLKAKDIVTTLDASMSIEEAGFAVRRTRIGDTWVSEELKNGGDFGGEISGAWIFPAMSLCPDGIYAAAQLAALASENRLSRLADDVTSYPLLRGSSKRNGFSLSVMKNRLSVYNPISIDETDGVRLGFSDGWLLIRPSGTEPKIRVTAEARTEARVRQLFSRALEAINEPVTAAEKAG